jgi:hypothetical protein
MLLTELVYCVTVAFTVTEQADQLYHDRTPAHSTAVMQPFFGKASHHPGLSAPLQPRFGSLRHLAFPKAKIAVESEEVCECNGHTVHKFSHWCLTADWLAPRETDCSHMHSKASSDWLPSYIKATWPVLEIFIMASYFPDNPQKTSCLTTLLLFLGLLDPEEEEGTVFLWNRKYPTTHISVNTWIFICVICTLDESTLEQAGTLSWSIKECL